MSAAASRDVLRVATRGSALARVQTDLAMAALRSASGVRAEVVVIETAGDREESTPVSQLQGQGWFTSALEAALTHGSADAAIHSAKDLPTVLAPGLTLAAMLPRADPRDALISRDRLTLATLPPGSVVATGSPRRRAMLRAIRPDLKLVPVRGNVDTRLRKLGEGEFDALVLACAGMDRLGLGERIDERLDPGTMVPAPAQGVIAIETRVGTKVAELVAAADHAAASVCVAAERAVLRGLGGGCLLPLGGYARLAEGRLHLVAALADDHGAIRRVEVWGDQDEPEKVGAEAADRLR